MFHGEYPIFDVGVISNGIKLWNQFDLVKNVVSTALPQPEGGVINLQVLFRIFTSQVNNLLRSNFVQILYVQREGGITQQVIDTLTHFGFTMVDKSFIFELTPESNNIQIWRSKIKDRALITR